MPTPTAFAPRPSATRGRLADRADELDRRLEQLAAGVREAIAAFRAELDGLREPSAPPDLQPEARSRPSPSAEAAAARPPAPEGARLLALKMALDGRPREETAAYLSENFELDDPEALLDEVYARAGG